MPGLAVLAPPACLPGSARVARVSSPSRGRARQHFANGALSSVYLFMGRPSEEILICRATAALGGRLSGSLGLLLPLT